MKEIVRRIIKTEEFQDSKVILEYGAAVGGIVMTFTQFGNSLADTTEHLKLLENKLDRLNELVTELCEKEAGIIPQKSDLNSEIIEQSTSNDTAVVITSTKSEDETVKSVEALENENEQLKKRIKELENQAKKQGNVGPIILFCAFAALVIFSRPGHAFTLIEEFVEN